MINSKSISLIVVIALIASASGAVVMSSAAAQPDIQISSVNVTPSDPAPGESVTVETTISNLESSNGTIDITDIYLRTSGTIEEQGRIEDVGSVSPGSSVTIPMSATFENTGNKHLTAHVVVQDEDGDHHSYDYPVYVTVDEPDEAVISFSTPNSDSSTEAVAGGTTPVNVTIANSHDQAITGVQLNLDGSGTVENPERVKGSIASGSEQIFQYEGTFDEVGTQTFTGEVTYKTAEGVTRTTTKSIDINVTEPTIDGDIAASSAPNQSSGTQVELTNFGNTAFTNVEVTATTNDEVFARTLMEDVEPDSTESVTVNVNSSINDPITYTATYTAAGTSYTTSVTDQSHTDQSAISGEIRLVGVETSQTGSGLTIEGEAANVGSTDAESVLLSVKNTDSVSPVASSGEYFVGTVEASEFATFELTADLQSDTSSIPVELTYIVDDTRVTTTQQLDVTSMNMSVPSGENQVPAGGDGQGQPGAGGPPGAGGSPSLPLTEIGIGLAVLLIGVVGFMAYRWRQQ